MNSLDKRKTCYRKVIDIMRNEENPNAHDRLVAGQYRKAFVRELFRVFFHHYIALDMTCQECNVGANIPPRRWLWAERVSRPMPGGPSRRPWVVILVEPDIVKFASNATPVATKRISGPLAAACHGSAPEFQRRQNNVT